MLGLPYAFASLFAPAQLMQALEIYRANFQPSEQLERPYVMLGFNVVASETDEEAAVLATSLQQAFVNLRSGRPSKLPPPFPGYVNALGPQERAVLDSVLSCSAIGSPESVKRAMLAFIERTRADELMVTSQIFDHDARLRSYEITARLGLMD
jgi:luciferase family oxidoreductase group 1